MSTKYFCDECGQPVPDTTRDRLRFKRGSMTIEIMVARNNVWNAGHHCPDCILRAIAEGEAVGFEDGWLSAESRLRRSA